MKKIIKEFNVYQFNELSEKAKDKAVDILTEMFIEDRFSSFTDECYEVLKDVYNIIDPKNLQYSLSNSQGDGLSFDVEEFNVSTIRESILKDGSVLKETKDLIKDYGHEDKIFITIKSKSRYPYAHMNQVSISVTEDLEDMIRNEDIMEDIRRAYGRQYLKIAKGLEDNGYNLQRVTLEEVEEYVNDNNIYFYEDGKMYGSINHD
jgi:hypothetical protein